jgi:hypothetical protein
VKLFKTLLCSFFLIALSSPSALAQLENVEVGGGYVHQTGNNGLDGFNVGGAYQFNRRVFLLGEADLLWDTSRASVLELTPSVGAVSFKQNSQNYLFGGRFRIIGFKPTKVLEKKKLLPFGEVLLGWSRLHQEVRDTAGTISAEAADKAFTWVLGGGVDYTLSHDWLARGRLDFVRTHFVDQGQSRLRVNIGLAYTF